jgi:hypothetical protein
MRRAIAILLAGSFPLQVLRPATEVVAVMPPGYENVSPNSAISFNLTVAGCDSVDVWANGVALGQVRHPYTVSFTTAATGLNVVDIVYCDWKATTLTNSYVLGSSTRNFTKRVKR